MEKQQISAMEYGLLVGRLDDLHPDEAAAFRSQLAETYYAYLDRQMQLKMAVRAYEQVVAGISRALTLSQVAHEHELNSKSVFHKSKIG
ncbi:MAG TPA: hypothetical protein VGM41_17485 [Chitinophagaceae bacterium]|jgi:hypothetical protein